MFSCSFLCDFLLADTLSSFFLLISITRSMFIQIVFNFLQNTYAIYKYVCIFIYMNTISVCIPLADHQHCDHWIVSLPSLHYYLRLQCLNSHKKTCDYTCIVITTTHGDAVLVGHCSSSFSLVLHIARTAKRIVWLDQAKSLVNCLILAQCCFRTGLKYTAARIRCSLLLLGHNQQQWAST